MSGTQESKPKQVLVCASQEQLEAVAPLFPSLEARYVNGGDWTFLEGRRAVVFGWANAHFANAYADECVVLPEAMPEDFGGHGSALRWAQKVKVPYKQDAKNASPQVAERTPDPEAGKVAEGSSSSTPPDARGDAPKAAPQVVREPKAHSVEPAEAALAEMEASGGGGRKPPRKPPETLADDDVPAPFPEDEAPRSGVWEQSLDGWPTPVDFWGDETGFMPTVEPDMLPGWLMDYVADQAALRGVDPVQPALQCLLAFSGALHNSHGLRPKPGEADYIERPVLWGATVGNPSTKKDAGQAIALAPLIPLDVEMRRRTAQLMQDRADADHAYQEALAAWRKGKQVGPRPVAPEPVPMDRLLVDNFTLEGLRGVLEHNSRGKVLVAVSELAGVFGNADAFTNNKGASKDMPMLLRLYQSASMIVDRAPPAPPVFVKSWAASIAGAIQPNIFHRVVQKMHLTDDGMLPRFLLVLSKNASAGEERPADYRAAENYKRVVALLVSMLPAPQPCNLSPEAQGVRRELLGWIYRIAGSGALTDGLASAVGKFEGAFARLCLVLHAAECAHASLPVIAPEVSEATAVRVRTLLLKLFYPHAAKFYADLGTETNYLKIPALIAAFILHERVGELNATMLWRGLSSWRHLDKRQRDDALRTCCESGWLRKRGETVYIVNPTVHELFVMQRDREDARRERLTAIMREKMGREAGED